MEVTDVIVIGAGLIGSAAARHMAEAGVAVTLIGAVEGNPTGVHASHYDEARITRQMGSDPIWSDLARDAMNRYGAIEANSGIRFHLPCGHLRCDLPVEHPGSELDLVRAVCRRRLLRNVERSYEDIARRLPKFAFQADGVFHWEPEPAGIINPRRLIRAQISLARRAAAKLIHGVAVRVEKRGTTFAVRESGGYTQYSRRVLVAAGPYTNKFDLTPEKLALEIRPETVVLMEANEDLSSSLAEMPGIIWRFDHVPDVTGVYVLPPVAYPDGRVYVKVGADNDRDVSVGTVGEMDAYMTSSGSVRTRELLVPVLQALIPRLAGAHVITKPCLLTYTPGGYPMVDEVATGWFVVVGGCGKSAKSSDQIGKLASDMIQGEKWTGYSRATFQATRMH